MCKRVKTIATMILILSLTLASFTGCTQTMKSVNSIQQDPTLMNTFSENRYTVDEVKGEAVSPKLTENDEKIAESAKLVMYFNKNDFTIKIKDKLSGYVFTSSPEDDQLSDLNNVWKNYAKSLVAIDYYDRNGKLKAESSSLVGNKKVFKITKITNGLRAAVNFRTAQISFVMDFILKDDKLSVSISNKSLKEGNINKLAAVYVLPFLGAIYEDKTPGYIFIPDGSGALIKFDKQKAYTSPYEARVYGKDLGIVRQTATDTINVPEMQAFVPVFGMAHGAKQSAYAAVVEKGDEYAVFHAYPAGVMTPFNHACASFVYRSEYYQPTGKQSGGFNTYQENRNNFDIELSYLFLSKEEATYTGMAKRYRSYLEENKLLTKKLAPKNDIPIHIEALMSEMKKGLIFNELQPMTTVSDVSRWVDEFHKDGVNNLTVSLWGWEQNGVNGHKLDNTTFENKTGTKTEYESLIKEASAKGYDLFFEKNIMTANTNQFSVRENSVINIDGSMAAIEADKKPMFTQYFINNVAGVKKSFKALLGATEKTLKNVALKDVAMIAYSDFSGNTMVQRNDVITEMTKILKEADSQKGKMVLYSPNAYAFPYADAIFDVPTSTSQFLYARDSVPFIQIVLSGTVELFAPYSNFTVNSYNDILKLIDYGTYPSYLLTNESTYQLLKTNLNDVYSSEYSNWKNKIVSTYTTVNSALKGVYGKKIVDRTSPSSGISITEYEGGQKVIVNYTKNAYAFEGVSIKPQSARVIGG